MVIYILELNCCSTYHLPARCPTIRVQRSRDEHSDFALTAQHRRCSRVVWLTLSTVGGGTGGVDRILTKALSQPFLLSHFRSASHPPDQPAPLYRSSYICTNTVVHLVYNLGQHTRTLIKQKRGSRVGSKQPQPSASLELIPNSKETTGSGELTKSEDKILRLSS
ncbi:hypothetical protein CROQUDRAFT_108528 [Cronartium quercuum f. sp. fusiforme G11]|uniref:Uncharacterized protein n=1 Tax=Cronartium quercuum f. sp. fusiforme G11 TaxID=708437 RepID=A0A9P6NIR8_9BASI|nr:hypothetical protein CROQUDRAFT_108528 [Cronartium quercuum f. sp. fusiforme G11]